MEEEGIVNGSASPVSDASPVHPALLAGYIFFLFIAGATSLVYAWMMATIALEHTLHVVSNYFMASLCVSHILMGILTSLWCGVMMSNKKNSALKLAVLMGFTLFGLLSYFLNSMAIAADRYLKISRPLQYPRLATAGRCAAVIGALWCLSLVFGLAIFLSATLNYEPDTQESLSGFLQGEGFRLPMAVISDLTIFPSMIAVTFLIAALVRVARQQRRKIRNEMLTLKHLQDQQTDQGVNNKNAPQPRPNHPGDKITVYFIVHFCSFVVAWLPVSVSLNITIICNLTSAVFNPLLTVSGLIAILNTFGGTLFLAYVQPEHRQATRSNLKRMKRLFSGLRSEK